MHAGPTVVSRVGVRDESDASEDREALDGLGIAGDARAEADGSGAVNSRLVAERDDAISELDRIERRWNEEDAPGS